MSCVKLSYMLDARRLQLLHRVSAAGSITGAARTLHYTPSAVSQQIAALEEDAGLQLLVRMPRGVRLTEAGEVLAAHGQAIERQVNEAQRDLVAHTTLTTGRLRIAAFPSAGATLVPRLVSEFTRRHPTIDVTLDIREPGSSVEALRHGLIDVALIFSYEFSPTADFRGLEVETLPGDEIFVAVRAGSDLAEEAPLAGRALAEAAWIDSTDPDCALMLRHVAARAGFEPQVSFQSDDYMTVGRLVAEGLGVALVPGLAADAMPESVSLCPLRPSFVRAIAMVTRDQTPAVRAMREIVSSARFRPGADDGPAAGN